jgi:hypothetical protein
VNLILVCPSASGDIYGTRKPLLRRFADFLLLVLRQRGTRVQTHGIGPPSLCTSRWCSSRAITKELGRNDTTSVVLTMQILSIIVLLHCTAGQSLGWQLTGLISWKLD